MTAKPSYLGSVLKNKCPRCRKGDLFISPNPYKLSTNLKMHLNCPECGQPTEIEVGFYYGTGYVSYALSVAYMVSFFVAWYVLIGFNIYDNKIFWCLGCDIVSIILIQPLLMRLSRSIWLSWFVKYNANYKNETIQQPERINKGQMNNW
jgi:endogenous inhibitor of DNA gyrase (YacG/DUF329 family)